MVKGVYIIFLGAALVISLAVAKMQKNDIASSEADEVVTSFTQDLCNSTISFLTKPVRATEHYDIAAEQSLDITKLITDQTLESRIIASSVTCQQLKGLSYSGNAKEWSNFLDMIIKGMRGTGFTDLQFTLVGSDKSLYKTELNHKEYIFTGDRGGNKQVIYNLAVLNESKTTMFTLSVGGNEYVKDEVYNEFKRLVTSFKL